MSEEFRLALPRKRNLLNPNKWNVAEVLKLAGIGQYDSDYSDFKVVLPGIKVTTLRPRRIPLYLMRGEFDGAIVGNDIIEESWIQAQKRMFEGSLNAPREFEMPKEMCDLGCGYVDLAFIASSERWAEFQEIWKKEKHLWKDSLPNPTNLEKILFDRRLNDMVSTQFSWYSPSRALAEKRGTYGPLVCTTSYPFIIGKMAREIEKLRSERKYPVAGLEVDHCPGTIEEELEMGIVELGFESVATGESLRKRGLCVVQTDRNSTAKLYASNQLSTPANEEKLRIAEDMRDRINRVTKDIGEHVQVNVTYSMGGQPYEAIRGMPTNVPIFLGKRNDSIAYRSSFVMPGDKVPVLRKRLEEAHGAGKIEAAVVYKLSSLFGYCPLTTKAMPFVGDCGGDIGKVGKYPCADSDSLRPEHRKEAVLFELTKRKELR